MMSLFVIDVVLLFVCLTETMVVAVLQKHSRLNESGATYVPVFSACVYLAVCFATRSREGDVVHQN
jgi:flagellar biosynthesis protein FliQ